MFFNCDAYKKCFADELNKPAPEQPAEMPVEGMRPKEEPIKKMVEDPVEEDEPANETSEEDTSGDNGRDC